MPFGPVDVYLLGGLQPAFDAWEDSDLYAVRILPGITNLPIGAVLAETTLNQNAVHTLADTGATAGQFQLSFRGFTTTTLNYNDTAATVQNALNALPSIGAAGVTCAGGALAAAGVTITWNGVNFTNLPIELPTITIVTAFTGAVLTVVSTTVGQQQGFFGPYVNGGANGLALPKALNKYVLSTDNAGNITFATTPTGEQFGQTRLTAPVYIAGNFRFEDVPQTTITGITGGFLDANALTTGLWRTVQGSLAAGTGVFRLP